MILKADIIIIRITAVHTAGLLIINTSLFCRFYMFIAKHTFAIRFAIYLQHNFYFFSFTMSRFLSNGSPKLILSLYLSTCSPSILNCTLFTFGSSIRVFTTE